MKALLSVSDKDGIVEFAMNLLNLGYELISTGGTYKSLKEANLDVREISSLTKFPEMFDGRVKTLNPKIHGAILYKRDDENHIKTAKEYEIPSIDLVCVNLYPFKECVSKTDDFDEIIENIDIGGPTLIRSAAKNFKSVVVVTNPQDYDFVIENLKGENSLFFRQNLMIKAYEHTANYDAFIANYMNKRFNNGFGEQHFIVGSKAFDTKYGENPHQKGALYEFDYFFTNNFKILKGEPSFNNLTDINAALKLAATFGKRPAISIIKHANPCGFAIKSNLLESYTEALKCDPISAYGGVVAINGKLDVSLAEKINEIYIEVIICANADKEAIDVFKDKKRIKIFTQNEPYLVLNDDLLDFKHIDGGFVLQNSDKVLDSEIENMELKSSLKADEKELEDLEIAYKIAALTKSNCISYVKNQALVAIGMGMTSRIDAAKAAVSKALSLGLDLNGSSMASEAFFPFRDSIDEAAKVGVKAIIQPGGSIRDKEVIKAANEHQICLYFTNVRHFLH